MSFELLVWAWIALALGVLLLLCFVPAPYGKHIRDGWGPTIDDRAGWFLMECTSLIVFGYFFAAGSGDKGWLHYFFAALWMLHYLNRALLYPFRKGRTRRQMPLVIAAAGFVFNCINGYFNGYYLGSLATYDTAWVFSASFVIGVILFAGGAAINLWSDEKLIRLKRENKGYRNPRGGIFEKISCPNYSGEIIEWGGFALMTLSLPALSFFIWTVANLAPRAIAHNKWYREHFNNEPPGRKALLPGLI